MVLGCVGRAVETNPDFKVHVVVCGISYTHRDRLRGDVCVKYDDDVIVVDKSWIEGNGQ